MEEWSERATLLAWKMEEGARTKQCQQPLEGKKAKEMDSPLESPERTKCCHHLAHSPMRPVSDF